MTRWMPAMQHSTLKISPDDACLNPRLQQWNWGCICGVQTYNYNRRTNPDALVIKAGRSDSNGNPTALTAWEQSTHTDVGYDHMTKTQSMEFGVLNLPYRYPPAEQLQYLIQTMTHELGHAIGLDHEHQRPDRDKFVYFYHQYVAGYSTALQNVMANTAQTQRDFHPAMAAPQRVALVAESQELAEEYFPALLDYIKAPRGVSYMDDPGTNVPYDYGSIMGYDSYDGTFRRKLPQMDQMTDALQAKFPLLRKVAAPEQTNINSGLIYMGGSFNPGKTSISLGDIKRVNALYPLPDRASNPAVQSMTSWQTVRASIAELGIDYYVSPAPPDTALPNRLTKSYSLASADGLSAWEIVQKLFCVNRLGVKAPTP